ncbi:hypothetical protein EDD16DRAFT_1526805 [Pisolithus croceorrhizus]|nr:hypothetical protein EDD16DRAFT_1526805 [Pisolithus croceorrhizus]
MPPRSNWSPTSIFMQQPALSMSFSPMQPCINDLQCRVPHHQSNHKLLRPAYLHLAPPSAATIKRSMPQVKHVDSEAMQIKHVDKVMIFMYEQSVLLIQHVDEIIISAHERSMLLIKHINDEANSIKHIDDEVNTIKHVDDKGGMCQSAAL